MVLEDLVSKGKGFVRRGVAPLVVSLLVASCGLKSCEDDDKKGDDSILGFDSDVPEIHFVSDRELSSFSRIETDKIDQEYRIVLSEPEGYSEGDVIVSGVSDRTPNGILVEVAEVSPDGTVIETIPASLEHVVEDSSFSFNEPILPGNEVSMKVVSGEAVSSSAEGFDHSYDFRDVVLFEDPSGDQLLLNGNVAFSIVPDIQVSFWKKSILAQVELSNQVELNVDSDAELQFRGMQESYPLIGLPIIPIPGTPIVVTPTIDIVVGALPGAVSSFEAGVSQNASLIPGLSYIDGRWTILKSFDNEFNCFVEGVGGSLEMEVYAGPALKLHFNDYGLISPALQTGVSGNLEFETDSDSWCLFGGLSANIGVDPGRFLRKFVDPYNKKVLEKRTLLMEGELGSGDLDNGQDQGSEEYVEEVSEEGVEDDGGGRGNESFGEENPPINEGFLVGDPISFVYNGEEVTYNVVSFAGLNWMDRNLGASRRAESLDDGESFGDLFQWGREADGHQKRDSEGRKGIAPSGQQPGHGDFILMYLQSNLMPWEDWNKDRSWIYRWVDLGGNKTDADPCPEGWRVPSNSEWKVALEYGGWQNMQDAFDSALRLPAAGYRLLSGDRAVPIQGGKEGFYWCGDYVPPAQVGFGNLGNSPLLRLDHERALVSSGKRSNGRSVRCIQDN